MNWVLGIGVAFNSESERFRIPGGKEGNGGGCSCELSADGANEGLDVFSAVDRRSPPPLGTGPDNTTRAVDIDGARRIVLINLVPNPEVIDDDITAGLVAGNSRDWGIGIGGVTTSSGSE